MDSPASSHPTLDRLIAEFLEAEQLGRKADRQEILARHPEWGDALTSFFANHDRLRQLAQPTPDREALVAAVRQNAGALGNSPYSGECGYEAITLAPARSGTVHEAPTLPPDSSHSPYSDVIDCELVRYFGDYELLAEIARGGMGVVYKARQVNLNRVVALKMILAGNFASPEDVQRFHTEAEAAANLDHPGIVPIYEVGQFDGQHFFSMGFIEGPSLAARIASGPLPPGEAAELTRKIAEAVAYAHSKGVIHRDLKPANILLASTSVGNALSRRAGIPGESKDLERHGGRSLQSGESNREYIPKITDFGLAKKIETESGLTQTGAILGTPSYMPPEQAAGKAVGPLADVYSLGAILYCMLTGRPPFQASSPLDTLLQVLSDEPLAPRQLNPRLPRDLETICLKCLNKEPARRYAGAVALADDVARFLAGEPIKARPVGRLERAGKWVRRNLVVSLLMAAVVLVLLGGIAVSSLFAVVAILARVDANLAQTKAENKHKEADLARVDADKERTEAWASQRRAEQLDYAKNLKLAQQAHQKGDVLLAMRHLEDCQAYLRGWEHDHLRTRFSLRTLRTVKGTGTAVNGPVICVAISPDGKRLVLGNHSDVEIRDAATGKVLHVLKGPAYGSDNVSCVAISSDGERIVSGGGDNTVKVWDARTGKLIHTLEGNTKGISGVAISPDGSRLVTCSGDTVKIWDAKSGQELRSLTGHTSQVGCLAISPDGKRLVSGSMGTNKEGGKLKIWDLETGTEIRSLAGHQTAITCVAISPDGQRIVSGSRLDQVYRSSRPAELKIWDAETGEEKFSFTNETASVYCVAISPDGKRIFSGSGDGLIGHPVKPGEMKVVDAQTGQELSSYKVHTGAVYCLAISKDGERIFTGSTDNTLKVWNAALGQVRSHRGTVNCVAVSHDGKRIVTGGEDRTVKLVDAHTGQVIHSLDGHLGRVDVVAISNDGSRIASVSSKPGSIGFDPRICDLRVWDANTGKEIFSRQGIQSLSISNSVVFGPDSKRIVSVGANGILEVWNAQTGQMVCRFDGHAWLALDPQKRYSPAHMKSRRWPVMCLAISPDGKRVCSWGNGMLKVWDLETSEELSSSKIDAWAPNISPNWKRLVSFGKGNTLNVFDADTGEKLLSLAGHTSSVSCVMFSPDGRRIFSGSADNTLKVWDAETGQELLSLLEHTGAVQCMAISGDGNTVVSSSADKTWKVWEAK